MQYEDDLTTHSIHCDQPMKYINIFYIKKNHFKFRKVSHRLFLMLELFLAKISPRQRRDENRTQTNEMKTVDSIKVDEKSC